MQNKIHNQTSFPYIPYKPLESYKNGSSILIGEINRQEEKLKLFSAVLNEINLELCIVRSILNNYKQTTISEIYTKYETHKLTIIIVGMQNWHKNCTTLLCLFINRYC
jgi:hypothetical protein